MSKGLLGRSVAAAMAVVLSGAMAIGCEPRPDCGCGEDGSDCANDPAFAMTDPVVKIAALRQQARLTSDISKGEKSKELIEAEQRQFREFSEALAREPGKAYDQVLDIWQTNASEDLQRLVIMTTLPLVKRSEESESLQFMLKVLAAPEAERAECERLGRGNSLEKSIARKRIGLLEGNARLRLAARR